MILALAITGWAAAVRGLWIDIRDRSFMKADGRSSGWWGLATGCWAIEGALLRNWVMAAIGGLAAALSLLNWWRGPRKRKRALAILGAKSRALLRRLVRKTRQAAKPRPVLKPAPQGARS